MESGYGMLFALGAVGGFFWRASSGTGYVHEWGHVIAAFLSGGQGWIIDGNHAGSTVDNALVIYGGAFFEVLFWALLAMGILIRFRRYFPAGVFLGAAHFEWLFGTQLSDFNRVAAAYWGTGSPMIGGMKMLFWIYGAGIMFLTWICVAAVMWQKWELQQHYRTLTSRTAAVTIK